MLRPPSATGVLAAPTPTVARVQREGTLTWWKSYSLYVAATSLVAALAVSTAPRPFSLAFVLLMVVVGICVARPAAGVYLVVFFAVLGDPAMGWYPFNKDFSSPSSILYINNQIIFNPLELCLLALTIGWILQLAAARRWTFRRGRLFVPMMLFTGTVLFGLAHGLKTGGDTNAALWEVRSVLYLPLLYLLLTNLFTERKQYQRLYWLISVAVFGYGLVALQKYNSLSSAQREQLQSIVSHGATLPMNALLVLLLASLMFPGGSLARRALLPFMLVPLAYIYILSERRAAFIALIAALGLLGITLFWTNRAAFWKVVPVVLVVGTLYTAAFWSDETSSAGFPAQAIKSVIAPGEVSDRNQSSDQYRILEKYDLVFTMKSSPVLGIGFGKPFLRPAPLPPIAPFLLEPYMPHNSILWMWLKTGVAGFALMVFLFGLTIHTGGREVLRRPRGDSGAITLTSTAFVVMYAVFAYVDIAWDPSNIVLLGVAMAQIGSARVLRKTAEADQLVTIAPPPIAIHAT
jgi:hypothetical protein